MNTENNPQTIFETPGLCTTIMKIDPNPIPPAGQFHSQLMSAKSKAQVIDILCARGSAAGWFSDMPDGLFEKLTGMRSSSHPKP
jgi:hypothetical protein